MSKMRCQYWIKVFVLLQVSVGLSACGLLSPVKTPPESVYTIAALKPAGSNQKAKTQQSILVSLPVANPGYQTTAMRYMMTPYKLQSFVYSRWVASPSNMMAPVLVQALWNQHYFKAVVSAPFAGITTYRLDTQLIRFDQSFMLPTSQLNVVMQASLMNTNSNTIVASKRFVAVVNAPGNNPYAGVRAANAAVSGLSQQIARWVVARAE